MDGSNLGRAEFLKTVTKEQPGWRLCLCGWRGGGLFGMCSKIMHIIKTTAILGKACNVYILYLYNIMHFIVNGGTINVLCT